MHPVSSRPTTRRRGLTLVEMLITVALLLLIMTVFVSIFQSATTAMTAAQTEAELAQATRQFEATLRADLEGATARFKPPVNPEEDRGYFEYGEGAGQDLQGEDTDDYIAFTAHAPEGQPFTGRVVLATGAGFFQQVTVTSLHAEILYFLRNGNLYRRVLLVAPNQGGLVVGTLPGGGFDPPTVGSIPIAGVPASWQGLNDISVHPSPATNGLDYAPQPTSLRQLTNREYRIFRPRFADDYTGITGTGPPDDKPDDLDLNRVPDFYPTLYPNAVINRANNLLNNNPFPTPIGRVSYDTLPFPFLFPGSYSQPNPFLPANYGSIHSLDPTGATFNHAPLEFGDSLERPTDPQQFQTWWGFPTWQETLSRFWTSPVKRINELTGTVYLQAPGLSRVAPVALPPVLDQPFNDRGFPTAAATPLDPALLAPTSALRAVYQDDVIMTGVRSFDVKAYDPWAGAYSATLRPGYYDLGYANLVNGFNTPALAAAAPALLRGFGHEGRIPPLVADYRRDPRYPALDLGDDTTAGPTAVVRMRRVWDSWSTDYSNAPDVGIDSNPSSSRRGLPTGARYTGSFGPIYPAYPAPYPTELRSIQVQIRIVDPRNERVKVLTIRHDFTDKLGSAKAD